MKKTVTTKTFVPAPIDVVYETFTNHNSYKQLPGVLSSKLLKEGQGNPSSGVGAIREVKSVAFTLKEEVKATEVPVYWDYYFHQWPLPVPHAGGRMAFEAVDGGTLVVWETAFELKAGSAFSLASPAFSFFNKLVIKSLPQLLKRLAVKNAKRQAS
jgi:hypothetical protein